MHIMLDLETMGTSLNAPILSIGAVAFSHKGIDGRFYAANTLKSAVDLGGVIDPDTVMWWLGQSDAARGSLARGRESLMTSMHLFSMWCSAYDIEGVWGNGSDFDNAILTEAYKRADRIRPWEYHKNRCFRTLNAIAGEGISTPDVGTSHNALDDAEWQANRLIQIWEKLGLGIEV